jgi:hypothetical protein
VEKESKRLLTQTLEYVDGAGDISLDILNGYINENLNNFDVSELVKLNAYITAISQVMKGVIDRESVAEGKRIKEAR